MKKGVLIIGFGNMGSALYKGLRQIMPEDKIYVCDSTLKKANELPINRVSTQALEFIDMVDTVIIAVKPQSFESLGKIVNGKIKDKIVISIMAGISIDNISKKLEVEKIVRTMPNLNIQVGKGLIAWIATSSVLSIEKILLRELFGAFGEDVEVKEEFMIDKISPLSGSGPAYFFYLCELMTEKAKDLGFSDEDARKIGESTFMGAGKLLEENSMSSKEWREAVTSKAGITEAALNHLKGNSFDKIFYSAIDKAVTRSEELNQ